MPGRGSSSSTTKTLGRLDLLFNNAGVAAPSASIEDVTLQQWKHVVDVNLTGTFLCTQEAFRLMKTQNPSGGRHAITVMATKMPFIGLG